MKKGNVIQTKSYAFSLRVVQLYKSDSPRTNQIILSQLLRSGTSIGANVEEAIGAQSTRDFYAKLYIAYKEAREAHYWLRLLGDSEYLERKVVVEMLEECNELLRILGSILKTLRSK
ncbi:MAG: four helix bundle protein [Bacteroidota bacterium]